MMVYYFSGGCSVAASSFDNFGPRIPRDRKSRADEADRTIPHTSARDRLNTVHNRAQLTFFNFNNNFIILSGQRVR